MPCFIFDVSDSRCERDTESVVFVDEIAARREAIRRAVMLVRATNDQPEIFGSWKLNVRDSTGTVVFWVDSRLGIMMSR